MPVALKVVDFGFTSDFSWNNEFKDDRIPIEVVIKKLRILCSTKDEAKEKSHHTIQKSWKTQRD